MTNAELLERLAAQPPAGWTDHVSSDLLEVHWSVARRAFMANLWAVTNRYDTIPSYGDHLGLLAGEPHFVIPDHFLRAAHSALIFPWSRAIVSRVLYGPGMVRPDGLPEWYERAS